MSFERPIFLNNLEGGQTKSRAVESVELKKKIKWEKEEKEVDQFVDSLGGVDNIKSRFESFLIHIINNIQIVGFQFISSSEKDKMFTLQLKKKNNFDLNDSIIHASQFLDKLACAVNNDKFIRDKFTHVQVEVIDAENEKSASANVKISVDISKVQKEMKLDEYIKKIEFETNNFA